MIRLLSLLFVLFLAPEVGAQEVSPALTETEQTETVKPSAQSVYAAKIIYRDYLRRNNLNPTDEEIKAQIEEIKKNPDEALQKLMAKEPAPKQEEMDTTFIRYEQIRRQKPKRLGNHPLGIDESLF